jgi:hypothetical protein
MVVFCDFIACFSVKSMIKNNFQLFIKIMKVQTGTYNNQTIIGIKEVKDGKNSKSRSTWSWNDGR